MDFLDHPQAAAPATPLRHRARAARWLEHWLHQPGTAHTILVGSLIVTGLAWWATRHFATDEARQRFERRTDEIQTRIERRMVSYEAMLRSGVALFAADQAVTRESWRRFVHTLQPEVHYPGIQGFGVSKLLTPGELAQHHVDIRREGYPNYEVRPAGPRETYTAIIYLEPFVKRNLRAFGFDMYSEPIRRSAMQRARDTGQAAVSGIVTLVQEDGKDVQNGFLLYMPVYRPAAAGQPDLANAGRLWGWVYAPFRVKDLMTGILGSDLGNIEFRLHDGPAGDPSTAFYTSERADTSGAASEFAQRRELNVAGRVWTVVYEGRDFGATSATWQSNLVAACGLTIDLLLYWSIASLARRKHQVEREVARHQAVLEVRTETLTAVSTLSPDAVLVFECGADGEHRLAFANPVFGQWFEQRAQDLLGLPEAAVMQRIGGPARDDAARRSKLQDDALIVLAGPPIRVLRQGMRESGRQRVYYLRDVTLESEVDRLKNEFLSTAAHELRTPLASVYGFTELMLDDKLDPARRKRALGIVHRQAGVLKHLVDELLDLARIDARHGRDFSMQRLDLRRVAELAVESMQQPGVMSRIYPEVGMQPMWVDVDPAKMQQAIVNVLSNALKYSESTGTVSLSLQRVLVDGADQVALRVVDAGMGMTPSQCAQAFKRFYRADPSGHILGAGLGLSIVKEIVEIQGGRVELRSTLGAGTQLTIWMPLKAPPPGAPPRERTDVGAELEAQPA